MTIQGSPACHTVGRHSANALEWRADGKIIGQLQHNVLSAPYMLECKELVLESSTVGSKEIPPQPPAQKTKAWQTEFKWQVPGSLSVVKPPQVNFYALRSTCSQPQGNPLALSPLQGRLLYNLGHLSPVFSHRAVCLLSNLHPSCCNLKYADHLASHFSEQ